MCSKQALIKGGYHVNITLNDKDNKNFHLEILEDLYGYDVFLGLDFQKQHATAVTCLHGRSNPILRIKEAEIEVCSLTASKLMVARLFAKLNAMLDQLRQNPEFLKFSDWVIKANISRLMQNFGIHFA